MSDLLDRLSADERKIVERYRENVPVDINGLCGALGIIAREVALPESMSGFIMKRQKDGEESFRIYINSDEPADRRRFTLAHELSHYLLHREDLGDEYPENVLLRGGLPNKQEIEANKLAAAILMPYDAIDRYTEKNKRFTIAKMARHFKVSSPTMSIRLGIPLDM